MKAAPLLRRWLHRLREAGVRFHMRHRWMGWDEAAAESPAGVQPLRFAAPDGEHRVSARAVILALGGASWARLGSDGTWVPLLAQRGVPVAPLAPANCGFDAGAHATPGWSEHFRERFAGAPLKSVAAWIDGDPVFGNARRGECVVTATGIEGSLVYVFSAALRDRIAAHGQAVLQLDLSPERSERQLAAELSRPRGSKSMANHLRARAGIDGVKAGLLRELLPADAFVDPQRLAAAIKSLPIPLAAPRPIDEAISTAGGVRFEALDDALMLRALPGVFCAGEMLDWEAPTGGYLLTASMASGRVAGLGAQAWLAANAPAASGLGAVTQPRDGEPARSLSGD